MTGVEVLKKKLLWNIQWCEIRNTWNKVCQLKTMLRLCAINAPAVSVQFAHMVGIPFFTEQNYGKSNYTEVCKA